MTDVEGECCVLCETEGNKPDSVNIQCFLCRKQFHSECAGFTRKPAKSVHYSCEQCRSIPSSLTQILDIVKKTHNELSKEIKFLKNEADVNRNEREALKKENERLAAIIADMKTSKQQSNWKNFRLANNNDTANTKKELVLSDSTLSSIDESKLSDTKVTCLPGANISKLQEHLNDPLYHGANFERVIIMAGQNDLDSKNKESVSSMLEKFDTLIESVKAISSDITISSLCPRMDDCSSMVDPANSGLVELCNRKECHVITHVDTFTLADGSVNDGYLAAGKGPHLTRSGINKVARNLKLRIKEGITDINNQTLPST